VAERNTLSSSIESGTCLLDEGKTRTRVARLQMKVGHMDGMHCFIDRTSFLVKIKSVSLYNCRNV
jgi:hypothetical protein